MIHSLVYRDHKLTAENTAVDTLASMLAEPGVMIWVDLDAPTDDEVRLVMQEAFGVHPLTIEDCVLDNPMPKFEEI